MIWAIFNYCPAIEKLDNPATGYDPQPHFDKSGNAFYCVCCVGVGSETTIETFNTGQEAQAWISENTVQPEGWEL